VAREQGVVGGNDGGEGGDRWQEGDDDAGGDDVAQVLA
jgi:hypothetical protein